MHLCQQGVTHCSYRFDRGISARVRSGQIFTALSGLFARAVRAHQYSVRDWNSSAFLASAPARGSNSSGGGGYFGATERRSSSSMSEVAQKNDEDGAVAWVAGGVRALRASLILFHI